MTPQADDVEDLNFLKKEFEKQKKTTDLREIIFRHREKAIFNKANHLTTMYARFLSGEGMTTGKKASRSTKEKSKQEIS